MATANDLLNNITRPLSGQSTGSVSPVDTINFGQTKPVVTQAPLFIEDTQPLGTISQDGGGGGGTTEPSYDPVELALLERQLGTFQGLLGDSDTFERQGLQSLDDSFTSNKNTADLGRARASQDFGTASAGNRSARDSAIGATNDNARTLANSLRRILGLAGGSSSSARGVADFAVAREASKNRGSAFDTFAENQGRLVTGDKRATEDYEKILGDLEASRSTGERDLRFGLEEQKQSLNDRIQQIIAEITGLKGGNQLTATQPYADAITASQREVAGLGDRFRTDVSAGEFSSAPIDLDQFKVDRQAINANRQAGQSTFSPYSQFLNRDREEERTA